MTFRESVADLTDRVARGTYVPTSTPSGAEIARYREELQLDLLQETIAYVKASVPYYDAKADGETSRLPTLTSLDDLRRLPILTKHVISTMPERFISRSCTIVSYQCTSGTTGRRLPVPVAKEENDTLAEYGALRASASKVLDKRAVVLRVVPPARRLVGTMDGAGRNITLTTTLNLDAADQRFPFDYVDHIMLWLTEPIPTPTGALTAEVLWTAPPFMVRTITEALTMRSFDLCATAIKVIATSGGIVTAPMADYVADKWNVPLAATYSMTEMVGSHFRCNRTGWYHFDLFPVVEIVDPETQAPARRNEEGVAVLTSLYPFQQARPLLRYWTGDVFTLRKDNCECGFVGSSGIFRGRLNECVDVSGVLPPGFGPILVGPADVLEVLHTFDELPNAHKQPTFRLSVVNGARSPQILLELEVYPGTEQGNGAHLRRQIAARFARRFQSLDGQPLDGELIQVSLVTKGLLANATSYYPDR